MKFRLHQLALRFKAETVTITFADFNYFYGEMGAGKSSIARLIDYCLGGDLVDTRALQNEFVWASLHLSVNGRNLTLVRDAHSARVRAQWNQDGQPLEIILPARDSAGEVLPETGVETLSDLIFYLAGITPPRVRRGRQREDSELVRLSLRDLLWFCYLDQDSMDSGFFHLDRDANPHVRLKSVAVLRYILGFHHERVAELEAELESIRRERLDALAGHEAIKNVLTEAELPSELDLAARRRALEQQQTSLRQRSEEVRGGLSELRNHAADEARTRARQIGSELADAENAVAELRMQIERDKAHRNELLNLGTRFRRAQSARAVLGGVAFHACPRCAQTLPERPTDQCGVCGLPEPSLEQTAEQEKIAEADLDGRLKELDSMIGRQEKEAARQSRLLRELTQQKQVADAELSELSRRYDSAYLSQALELEKQIAVAVEQLAELKRYETLIARIERLRQRANHLAGEESRVRTELKETRERAERDTQNLQRLKQLFLDCLVRARVPGILASDRVEMTAPFYLPEIYPSEGGELTSTAFSNLGSGGKKTLFKACFAVAIHRLAVERGANLPTLLIIDSPMKNISERINRRQFEGFHEMLYGLARTELRGTQIVLIDKEFLPPPEQFEPSFENRFMTPDRDDAPPLITKYRGK